MTHQPAAGYREREHTADWELEVWAPDFPALLEQAARGFYALSGARLAPGARRSVEVDITASDRESLLVKFLQELVYLGEIEGLGFESYDLQLDGFRLRANLLGAALEHRDKEIKAVTYHNLEVRESARGLEARLVLDV